jgi:hypothetical protein
MATTTRQRPTHDEDLAAWALDQARRLRELARMRPNEPLDWELLADEIEDMGKGEQRAAEAFVKLILAHLLKLEFARDATAVHHRRKELQAFRSNYRRRATPSIHARLQAELPAIYEVARAETIAALWQDADLEDRVPCACPYRWEQVTGDWLPERLTG